MDVASFVKKNLVWIVAIVVILGVLKYQSIQNGVMPSSSLMYQQDAGIGGEMMKSSVARVGIMPPVEPNLPPVETDQRLVIKETDVSLLVKKVDEVISKIEELAKQQGGFFVSSSLNKPEESETGNVVIRVPEDKRGETLKMIKEMGVRVVSENVSGTDVTDQYVDVESRLATLETTKRKLESLLDQAANVTEILNVQRELDNLQYQIDSLKGQKQYLEQSAKLSRITIYLSTDELALPYAPDEAWRPEVIFKQAVRSLVRTGRGLVNGLIWLAVYSPLWISALVILWLWKKKRNG